MLRVTLVIFLVTVQFVASTDIANVDQHCDVMHVDGEILTADDEIVGEDSWECIKYGADGGMEEIYKLCANDIHPEALEKLARLRAKLSVNKGQLSADNTTLLYGNSLPGLAKASYMVNTSLNDQDPVYDPYGDVDVGVISIGNTQAEEATIGTRTVLVVRMLMNDTSPTVSAAQVRDAIFGTGHRNMCSQYAACSKDQLIFAPATGVDIEGGVLDLRLDMKSTDTNKGLVFRVIDRALIAKYGSVVSFDHVMICTPATWGGWIAFAYIGSRYSVYRDRSILYLSVQMHEIGHNLGLHHAGANSKEYGDTVGMMGYSFFQMYNPAMCFNGAKNYQLGWFRDCDENRERGAEPKNVIITRELIGSGEYSKGTCQDNQKVTLRYSNFGHSLYISYNKRVGPQSGTRSAGNQVVLHTNNGNGKSVRVGILNVGQTYSYTFTSFPEPLNVQWCEIVDGRAVVAVSTTFSDPCKRITTTTPTPETTPPPEITPRRIIDGWYDEFDSGTENSAPRMGGMLSLSFAIIIALFATVNMF